MRPGILFMWPPSRYPDHTAVVFKDTRLTFAQFDALVNQVGNGLLSLGLCTGQKVAVLLNNGIESAVTLLAIPRVGLTYVSLNARHTSKEHAYILNDAEADVLIIAEAFQEHASTLSKTVPSLKHIIVTGQSIAGQLDYKGTFGTQSDHPPDVTVDMNKNIERIQYTSGTTGKPKGVVWTFGIGYNVLTNVLINMDQPIGPETVNLNIGPLTHAAGLMMMVYYSRGATNIILPGFDVQNILETIEREKVTSLLLIPTMLYRLLMSPDIHNYDLSSVKRVWYGTAPMAVDRLKAGIRIFGNVFRQNYGMSEIAQPITYLGPEDHIVDGSRHESKRLASAGKPAMGVELKIVSEDGREVTPGEVGEIVLRSNKLMKAYWKQPEKTAQAFRGGWFHTKDMATRDRDGFVYIVDRKSDMIISGGFNIYPREIEEVIMTYPGVAETAVIGVPDPEWGEAVKAVVVAQADTRLSAEEIIQHCRLNLSGYKKPKSIEFIQKIPKSPYGKIDRRSLKKVYWEGKDRLVH